MKLYRDCGSEVFNTGSSKCPFSPDYIKVILLTPDDMSISLADFETELEKMIHANRPNRVYPVGLIAEYAPSGGDAQTSRQGYGASQITGYSELIETWTLEHYDEGLYANLMKLKNERMRAIFIDKNNVVYAMQDGDSSIKGFKISSIYPSGQRFKTSSADASMSINLVYEDVEKAFTNSKSVMSDIDLVDSAKGLVWVDVVSVSGGYKVVEHYGGYDMTEMYGTLLGEVDVWDNVTAATYDAATAILTITPTSGKQPLLKSPADLFTAGIKGIEQWGA